MLRWLHIKWLQVRVEVVLFLQWMHILSYRWYKCEIKLAEIQADIFARLLGVEKRPVPTKADIEMVSNAVKSMKAVMAALKGIKGGNSGSTG